MQRTRRRYRISPARRLLLMMLALVALSISVSGCATRKPLSSLPADKETACPAPEKSSGSSDEVVELAIPPVDDGLPLTPAEQAALASTGEVDRNLSPEDYRAVVLHFKYYTHRARGTMERLARRSQNYLPYVREVLRKRGLPEELAYLAIVESGYNPNAVSSSGAVGIWQFMPYTGKLYGLDYDWWIDERRDPYKATHSAASYLAKLYGDFNDWHLALAAYNAGEGKIGRALAGTGAKGFFELVRRNESLDEKARLKDETKQYVPRFIAITKIMRNLQSLGFAPLDTSCAIRPVEVRVRPGTDLMALAQASGMSWASFSDLNPAFRRYVSPPDAHSVIYLPEARREAALAYLAKPQTRNYAGWQPYTVRKGDTLERVGKRAGVPVSVLKQVNKVRSNNLKVGSTLLIPGGTHHEPDTGPAIKRALAERRGSYIVKQGDTLYSIARTQGVELNTLMQANGMAEAHTLRVGQKLYIPGGSEAPAPQPVATSKPEKPQAPVARATSTPEPRQLVASVTAMPVSAAKAPSRSAGPSAAVKTKTVTYKVQQGDTMWAIARKFNVHPKELMRQNRLEMDTVLRPGDSITVTQE